MVQHSRGPSHLGRPGELGKGEGERGCLWVCIPPPQFAFVHKSEGRGMSDIIGLPATYEKSILPALLTEVYYCLPYLCVMKSFNCWFPHMAFFLQAVSNHKGHGHIVEQT